MTESPWGAGDRFPLDAVLRENASEERLHQAYDTLIRDAVSHPSHKSGMVEFVEARRNSLLKVTVRNPPPR